MNKFTLVLVLVLIVAAGVRWLAPAQLETAMNTVEPHAPYSISVQAQKLHDSLFIVDMHSDSLLWDRNLAEQSSRGHVDLPRLQQGNVGLQVFSATTKSPRGQNYEKNSASSDNITSLAIVQGWPLGTWRSLYARAQYQLEKLQSLVEKNPQHVMLIRTKKDFQALLENRALNSNSKLVGAMYLIEGAHPLEGELKNLDALHAGGLHFVGLTHFFDNRLGGSLHGSSKEGLTAFGKEVVQRANHLEMTIDIAHASPAMVRDVLALSERPVVLSHGGFKGACDTPRNLEDELMQEVANRGGIIGVGYWEAATCDSSPEGIVKSIRYGIDLIGYEHIALGSDFDGAVATKMDTSELAVLTQEMMDSGFSEQEIRAVMGDNMKRFLLQQLPTAIAGH